MMIENYLKLIESICLKLNNKIVPSNVLNWLSNFSEEDWSKALTVLNNIEYYSEDDTIREFDLNLEKLIVDIEKDVKYKNMSNIITFFLNQRSRLFNINYLNERIVLHPIGEFLKSGTSMFYSIKQTPSFKKYKGYIEIAENIALLEKKLKKDCYLVLVDDIVGSGQSTVNYYKKLRPILTKPKFSGVKVLVLSIVYLEKSKKILGENQLKIYGNFRKGAFTENGSVFGYRPKMIEIREFCYRYGSNLYVTTNPKTNEKKSHNLGHNNSQALIVFAHSVPNNTLPIFWSSRKNWKPIFPRFGEDKILSSYDLKFNTQKWISMLESLGFGNLFRGDMNKYSKINVQQLMILRLKKGGKNDDSICQYLNINKSDYNRIIGIGINNEIFTSKGNISDYGNRIYSEIKKKELLIQKNEIELRMNEIYSENIYYLPSMFRGLK